MSILHYDPFYHVERFVDALDPIRTALNIQPPRKQDGDNTIKSMKPKMDLHEDTEKNLVTATFELPGLKKEDVSIDIHNGRLTISAEAKTSSEELKESGYAVRERWYGKLSRILYLPQGIKEEEIKASMENGVLTVTFPRTAPELRAKKIRIA